MTRQWGLKVPYLSSESVFVVIHLDVKVELSQQVIQVIPVNIRAPPGGLPLHLIHVDD